jgi:hypothetical protein
MSDQDGSAIRPAGRGRGTCGFNNRYGILGLDLLYIDNWSLGLDLAILANTAHSVTARAVRALLPRGGHRRERLASLTAKPSLADTPGEDRC